MTEINKMKMKKWYPPLVDLLVCVHEVCCLIMYIHSSTVENVYFSTLINAAV